MKKRKVIVVHYPVRPSKKHLSEVPAEHMDLYLMLRKRMRYDHVACIEAIKKFETT